MVAAAMSPGTRAAAVSLVLISHDAPAERTEDLARLVADHAQEWRRPMATQWLVETEEDVDVWARRLAAVLGPDDQLLVTEVRRPIQGWLTSDLWEWVNERV